MRYINQKHLQRLVNLAAADSLCKEIELLPEDQRSTFIDEHEGDCSYLREALWMLGCGKCWYSEAILQRDEGHIEHFRPKKRLSGAKHPGYWWRAFDWTNLRLAHPTANRRITDYLSGKKAGKGGHFPLRVEDDRAETKADEGREEPVLLDPTSSEDCQLLCFETSSGKPIPRYKREADEWLHRRAVESIDYYHLDEATWTYKRKDLMDEVVILCAELERVKRVNPYDVTKYNKIVGELVEYLDPFSEFTAAALAVIRERGLLEDLAPRPED